MYCLLLAGSELNLVTLLRPRKHSIHPTDLHLLLNLIRSSPALQEVDNESWLPICLPKFNQEGFLYVYVTFIRPALGLVWVSSEKGAFEELRAVKTQVAAVGPERLPNGLLAVKPTLHPTASGCDLSRR